MGRGITLVIARRGIPVILYDLNPDIIKNASSLIEIELKQEVEKKRISINEKESILRCISFTGKISDCRAPLIIEAVIEKIEAKVELLQELFGINGKACIYATNTSSLSVTRIAEQTKFPEKIVGLHFFNPANKMRLVEVVKTIYTTDELIKSISAFSESIGKTPVICQDAPGFIVNHVARPFYLEALRLAAQNIADMVTIDKLMESTGFKMGPFHLMDLIGNDINFTVSCLLYEALGSPLRLKPSPLQEAIVKKGDLGKKTGSGFFQYHKA